MRIAVATLLLLAGLAVFATPSTTYWTPATPDFQPPGQIHLTYDSYVRAHSLSDDNVPAFPNDYGLEWGYAFKNGLATEFGFDLLLPSNYPLLVNGKIGYPEGALSESAPSLALGIMNVGTKKNVTTQNVIYATVGKTLPSNFGRLTAGYYVGQKTALGGSDNKGYMVGYDKVLIPDKLLLAADYASGKNAFGGGGIGLGYSFDKTTSILVGPVWFNEPSINGKMKLTVQVDRNF